MQYYKKTQRGNYAQQSTKVDKQVIMKIYQWSSKQKEKEKCGTHNKLHLTISLR